MPTTIPAVHATGPVKAFGDFRAVDGIARRRARRAARHPAPDVVVHDRRRTARRAGAGDDDLQRLGGVDGRVHASSRRRGDRADGPDQPSPSLFPATDAAPQAGGRGRPVSPRTSAQVREASRGGLATARRRSSPGDQPASVSSARRASRRSTPRRPSSRRSRPARGRRRSSRPARRRPPRRTGRSPARPSAGRRTCGSG